MPAFAGSGTALEAVLRGIGESFEGRDMASNGQPVFVVFVNY
jgi:hypothetical protein